MSNDYEAGYTMGKYKGYNDAMLLSTQYVKSDGTSLYNNGYKDGYIESYIACIASKLNLNQSKEMLKILSERLKSISECVKNSETKEYK